MESEEEFSESLAFVKEIGFAGGHVFRYSARPGTSAARLNGRVHGRIAADRSGKMREILQESAEAFAAQYIGRQIDVLWESTSGLDSRGWRMHGMSSQSLRVAGFAVENRWNKIDQARVVSLDKGNLEVELI